MENQEKENQENELEQKNYAREKALKIDAEELDKQILEHFRLLKENKLDVKGVESLLNLVVRRFYNYKAGMTSQEFSNFTYKYDLGRNKMAIDAPKIEIVDMSKNNNGRETHGELSYHPLLKTPTLKISQSVVEEILNGSQPVAKLMDTLGHEMRHWEQQLNFYAMKEGYEQGEFTQEEVEKISKIWKASQRGDLDRSEVRNVFALIKKCSTLAGSNKYENMSEAEMKTRCFQVCYSQYLQEEHEVDARQGGVEFCKFLFGYCLNSPQTDLEMRKFFASQLKEVKKLEESNAQLENLYDKYQEFQQDLKDLTSKDFINYENWFTSSLDSKPDAEVDQRRNVRKLALATMKLAMYESYKKKDSQEIVEDVVVCVNEEKGFATSTYEQGLYITAEVGTGLIEILSERNLSEEERKQCAELLVKAVLASDGNINTNVPIQKLLNQEEAEMLLSGLIEQGKIKTATQFLNNFVVDIDDNTFAVKFDDKKLYGAVLGGLLDIATKTEAKIDEGEYDPAIVEDLVYVSRRLEPERAGENEDLCHYFINTAQIVESKHDSLEFDRLLNEPVAHAEEGRKKK